MPYPCRPLITSKAPKANALKLDATGSLYFGSGGGNRLTKLRPGCPPEVISPVKSGLRVRRVRQRLSRSVAFMRQTVP